MTVLFNELVSEQMDALGLIHSLCLLFEVSSPELKDH